MFLFRRKDYRIEIQKKKKKSSNLSSKWFTIEPLGNIFVKQSRLSIPRKETSL